VIKPSQTASSSHSSLRSARLSTAAQTIAAAPFCAQSAYRFPAEWDPHEATWIGWPHNSSDWPGKFGPIAWVYGEIVRRLALGEKVRVLVNSAEYRLRARRVLMQAGVDLRALEFFQVPTDRGWTRDFGPIFVKRGDELSIAGFSFNGWAKYSNCKFDAAAARKISRRLGIKYRQVELGGREVVLEGGSIDVNGLGALVTTEECLLDPKVQCRNPGFNRGEIEEVMRRELAASSIVWLGRGIAGDDTHGHVDDLCRFTGPHTLVVCREPNAHDANYRPLEDNWERLQSARLQDGSKPEVVPLPMPAPLHFRGRRLPASYANFYISNAAVLVPTFNDPADRIALGTLAELFSDRPVVGIHAVDLVWGLGTLHCLTQQQPAVASPSAP
jgi:agmatine deiminase